MVIGPSDRNRRRWGWTENSLGDEKLATRTIVRIKNAETKEDVLLKEKTMSIKRVPISEAWGKTTYLDNYGLTPLKIHSIRVNDENGDEIKGQLYRNDPNREGIATFNVIEFFMNNDWNTSTPLYIINPAKRNMYYGYNNVLQPGFEKRIEFKSITVRLEFRYQALNVGEKTAYEEMTFKSKKEMDKWLWIFPSQNTLNT